MVTDETDKEGNFQVRLKAISHSRFDSSLNPSVRHPAYAVFPHVKSPTRDDFAI